MIQMDTRDLQNHDLDQLARGYARVQADESIPPRLRRWAYQLCVALTEELEARRETEQLIADELDEAGGAVNRYPSEQTFGR